jgi:hypothetical protein
VISVIIKGAIVSLHAPKCPQKGHASPLYLQEPEPPANVLILAIIFTFVRLLTNLLRKVIKVLPFPPSLLLVDYLI